MDDDDMPPPGNPKAYRCGVTLSGHRCGKTRRIRRGYFVCPDCDLIDTDVQLPPLRGGDTPFRPNPT